MSNNTVRVRLAFSFKGETYELDSVIDLDRYLGGSNEAPDFHRLLAKAAGIDPAKIHAYRRTGMLVTSENLGQWSAEDLDEWQAAFDEYESLSLRRN